MCLAVAIIKDEVPTELEGSEDLARRRYSRTDRAEYRFYANAARPRIPVIRDGQFLIVRWGNGREESQFLPPSLWASIDTLGDGSWRESGAVNVVIPASFGLDGRGVWYPIFTGVRGILVPDERGIAVAYMITEEATHYYQVMTGSRRMPVLIGQQI